jgi:hypothetical protein
MHMLTKNLIGVTLAFVLGCEPLVAQQSETDRTLSGQLRLLSQRACAGDDEIYSFHLRLGGNVVNRTAGLLEVRPETFLRFEVEVFRIKSDGAREVVERLPMGMLVPTEAPTRRPPISVEPEGAFGIETGVPVLARYAAAPPTLGIGPGLYWLGLVGKVQARTLPDGAFQTWTVTFDSLGFEIPADPEVEQCRR